MHGTYSRGHSQAAIELSTGSPMGELEKGPKELKRFAALQEDNNMSHPVLPELPGTKSSNKEYT